MKAAAPSRRRVPATRSQGGFTLIEVVISTALMAIILAGAYMCFDAGIKSEKMIDERTEVFQNARVAMALISADLRNACPINQDLAFLGMHRSIGNAQADNLDFATRNFTPRRPREGDFCETSYFLEKDRESGQLCLWRRRNPMIAIKPLSGGRRELLIRGVAGLGFEYFDGLEWYSQWGDADKDVSKSKERSKTDESEPTGLPESVRITLWLEPSDRGKSPGQTNEPPLVFQTVARLNLAAAAQDLFKGGGGAGSGGDTNSAAPASGAPPRRGN
jgi:type II secretion system protein J